jgi:L-glyceraldehyde 3-phosphate reductase
MYTPAPNRYDSMKYNRCGKSGLLLPAISLGLWHNFGSVDDFANMQSIVRRAFDRGVTHFDLANNYGPPPGEAEVNFGKILHKDLMPYRDELIISSKAGYYMWPGPYGEWGSRKYLIASVDQSLKRMGVDYVDIFYSHRPDPNTPMEETMMALDQIVRSGKALYAGISSYDAAQTAKASAILKELGTPCLIHQPKYSMFVRWVENGAIASEDISPEVLSKVKRLNEIASRRIQSLAQMALTWLMKDNRITSVLIGASSVLQLDDNLDSLGNINFSAEELQAIETILGS